MCHFNSEGGGGGQPQRSQHLPPPGTRSQHLPPPRTRSQHLPPSPWDQLTTPPSPLGQGYNTSLPPWDQVTTPPSPFPPQTRSQQCPPSPLGPGHNSALPLPETRSQHLSPGTRSQHLPSPYQVTTPPSFPPRTPHNALLPLGLCTGGQYTSYCDTHNFHNSWIKELMWVVWG